MLKENKVLQKLAAGQVVIGCQVRTGSPLIAELFGLVGYDYVFVEGEHFPYNIETGLKVIMGCELGDTVPIVRIPDADPGKILQYLDMGAGGLIIPHVNGAEDVLALRQAGKYRPEGDRGFSNTSRATGYGLIPMQTYKEKSNRHTMLMALIETEEGVQNCEAIMAAGIDAIHLGPGDLSESLGVPMGDKKLQDALDYVYALSKKTGVPVAAPVATVEEGLNHLRRGARMLSFSSDLALLRGISEQSLKAFAGGIAGGGGS